MKRRKWIKKTGEEKKKSHRQRENYVIKEQQEEKWVQRDKEKEKIET